MFAIVVRRIGIALLVASLVVVLSAIAFWRGLTIGIVLLIAAGIAFGYVVLRLSHAMFAANAGARRKARSRLILAVAVPALILTPTMLDSAPRRYMSAILLTSAIWIALAMSWTSLLLAAQPSARRRESLVRMARARKARPTYATTQPPPRRRARQTRSGRACSPAETSSN
ncbi:MAG TPA: hypothetical protein VN651_11040 [Gemmatimonadaceae bacterium]|nr:hypothetical protein [Gemmatimonadaceae bacterium]